MSEAFRRSWAMPSHETFSIRPIRDLLDRWIEPWMVVADPFARNSFVGTLRNDLDPSTLAPSHMDAEKWATLLDAQSVDAVLFDPPYSPRQIAEVYKWIGASWDGRNARFYREVKDALRRALIPGGLAVSFGWNTGGFGKSRGFARLETLIVNHGGAHNDTLVSVERLVPADDGGTT